MKLLIWECDDSFWVLAPDKESANTVYLTYQREWHGDLNGLEIPTLDDFTQVDRERMRKLKFYPNDEDDPLRTFSEEYEKQIVADPVTPRFFAAGE